MTAYLGLGTNLGDKESNLLEACKHINERAGHILALSSFHVSRPWGFTSDNDFLNAALRLQTELTPQELLHVIKQIELDMGRPTKTDDDMAYHDRIIDIDILLYDNLSIQTPELIIPHPLMYERDFVLIPLKEILTDSLSDAGNQTKS